MDKAVGKALVRALGDLCPGVNDTCSRLVVDGNAPPTPQAREVSSTLTSLVNEVEDSGGQAPRPSSSTKKSQLKPHGLISKHLHSNDLNGLGSSNVSLQPIFSQLVRCRSRSRSCRHTWRLANPKMFTMPPGMGCEQHTTGRLLASLKVRSWELHFLLESLSTCKAVASFNHSF